MIGEIAAVNNRIFGLLRIPELIVQESEEKVNNEAQEKARSVVEQIKNTGDSQAPLEEKIRGFTLNLDESRQAAGPSLYEMLIQDVALLVNSAHNESKKKQALWAYSNALAELAQPGFFEKIGVLVHQCILEGLPAYCKEMLSAPPFPESPANPLPVKHLWRRHFDDSVKAVTFLNQNATLEVLTGRGSKQRYNFFSVKDSIFQKIICRFEKRFLPQRKVLCAAYSKDGTKLAMGGEFGVDVWDRVSGRTLKIRSFSDDSDTPIAAEFSSDNQILGVVTFTNIYLQNAATGKTLRKIPLSDKGSSITFSADGGKVAAGTWNGVRLFDTPSGCLLESIWLGRNEIVFDVAFSLDGKNLASAAHNGLYLHDAVTLNVRKMSPDWAHSASFSLDNRLLAAGRREGISIFDTETWEILRNIPSDDFGNGHLHERRDYGDWLNGIVHNVSFSPDNKKLARVRGNAKDVAVFELGESSPTV